MLRTIRPDDLAPEISHFHWVSDELKPKPKIEPKTNGNGKARNGSD